MSVNNNNNNNKNMWAALLDKGYKGLNKYGRFMTPKKKLPTVV